MCHEEMFLCNSVEGGDIGAAEDWVEQGAFYEDGVVVWECVEVGVASVR